MADEVVTWVDADGGLTVLPAEWKARGRFMPPVRIRSDAVPGQSGEIPREVRHGVREFVLPLFWKSADDEALRTELRDILDKMNPANDDGTPRFGKVRVQSPLGDVREITCLYSGGLELDEIVDDASGLDWQKIPLTFVAHDPYWYDLSPVSSPVWTVTDVPLFFPILPVYLAASELVVSETITNTGSVEAWPVWTIRGPGSGIILKNLTTGLDLSLSGLTLADGQALTIDTRPGVKSVELSDGTDLYEELDAAASLWPLRKGDNTIRLEMSGVNATTSSLQVTYWRRYLAP